MSDPSLISQNPCYHHQRPHHPRVWKCLVPKISTWDSTDGSIECKCDARSKLIVDLGQKFPQTSSAPKISTGPGLLRWATEATSTGETSTQYRSPVAPQSSE